MRPTDSCSHPRLTQAARVWSENVMSNWKIIKCKVKEQEELSDGFLHGHWSWNTMKTFHNGCKQNTVLLKWTAVTPGWGETCLYSAAVCNLASSQSEAFTLRQSLSPTCSCAGKSLLLISRDQRCLLYSTCKPFCCFYFHRCDSTGLFPCSYY